MCNSSNHFLTAKTATFLRTVQVLPFAISRSQVETIAQIFEHVGVELQATVNVRKTELFLTMHHPRADLPWQMLQRGEGEVKKCPTKARGREMGALWN